MEPISTAAVLGATGISSAAGLASGLIQANSSKKLMKKQYELNRKWEIEKAKKGPTWQVEGLNAAGLNPILAARNLGIDFGSVNVSQADTSGYTSAGRAMTESANNLSDYAINKQNADANTMTAETTQSVGESTAAKNYQDAAESAERTKYIGGMSQSTTAKNWAEAAEKTSQIAVNKANVGLMESQADLTDAKTITEALQRAKLNSETALNRRQKELLGTVKGGGFTLSKSKKYNKYGIPESSWSIGANLNRY